MTAVHSSNANALAALLHETFMCNHCHRHHAPDSRLIRSCSKQFADYNSPGPVHRWWRLDMSPYYARISWRDHNGRWDDTLAGRFTLLRDQLHAIPCRWDFGPATLTELSAENGVELVRMRYAAWERETHEALTRSHAAAAPILAEVETLLLPPHPVGPPTAGLAADGLPWTPTGASREEIARITALFPHTVRVSSTNDTLILRVTFPRPKPDTPTSSQANWRQPYRPRRSRQLETIRQEIAHIFSSNRLDRSPGVGFVHACGLDPVFWESVTLKGSTLIMTTKPFSIMHWPADQNGQLRMPF